MLAAISAAAAANGARSVRLSAPPAMRWIAPVGKRAQGGDRGGRRGRGRVVDERHAVDLGDAFHPVRHPRELVEPARDGLGVAPRSIAAAMAASALATP